MHVTRLFCASLLFVASFAHAYPVDSILIGTGERGGNYYSVGGAICRMINRNRPSECTIAPTNGSLDNLYALDLEDVSFAIVQADVQRAAYQGVDDIPGDYQELRSVASVYTEVLTVVTRADSDIDGFTDLVGRRVSAGSSDSGSRWTFGAVMRVLEMAEEDLADFTPQSASLGAKALCEKRVDALVLMTGHPSAILSRLGEACSVRIVPFTRSEIDDLTGVRGLYQHATIPADAYSFIDEPIPTIGTDATVVTIESMPDAYVDALLLAIFGDPDVFRQQQHVIAPTPWWDAERGAPLHRAARQFYRERDPVQ